jgi:hypothetical protein
MKRSHSLLAITGLLCVGLCAAVYRAVRTAEGAPAGLGLAATRPIGGATTPGSAELAELRRELAQLERQVQLQGKALAAAPARAEAQAPDAADDSRQEPESRAEQERKHRSYLAGVEAAFRAEATDPSWSSASASAVQAALVATSELRPLARAVDCRSHTCRVEIVDDGSGKLGKLLPVFAQQIGHELPSITADRVVNGRGAATMVLYMSRRDESPPSAL